MGFVYVFCVMSMGFVAVVAQALLSKEMKDKALTKDLDELPGFIADHRVFKGGIGLAIDERARLVCLISSYGGSRKLEVIPFGGVLVSEILKNGAGVVRAGKPEEAVRDRLVGGPQAHEATAPEWARSPDEPVALRIVAGDKNVAEHIMGMSSITEAIRWHSMMKTVIARTSNSKRKLTAKVPHSGSRISRVSKKADFLESQAQPTGAQPTGAQPTGAGGLIGTIAADASLQGEQEDLYLQIKTSMAAIIAQRLQERKQFTIAERKLRDQCGVAVPAVRFHDCLNRLKREKALDGIGLSYAKRHERWRIYRRKK
jgi:hypothetical protein